MAKFKTSLTVGAKPDTPEALFRDLRGRSPDIKHLWSHQADVLRTFHGSHIKSADVALELPTGSGKTLVGLLIGEYRRLAFDERVTYLCPTRQLAHQVGAQAQRYGIKANVLVGPQANYDKGHYSEYVTAQAIAVTTYSGVFNSNPKLGDAHVLILDDAHAAENYIADTWTVSIDRKNNLYRDLLELLAGSLPASMVVRCIDDDPDPSTLKWVDKVPMSAAYPVLPRIVDLLDANLDRLSNIKYPWLAIRENLFACGVYVSWSEISLRPIIPPTRTHSAFSGAKQRVYMSATLGQAGDLERIVGVPKISKVPVPAGWDKQAIGRRLMLFPDRSLPESQAVQTALRAIDSQQRSLVMCPDKTSQHKLVGELQKTVTGCSIMGAESIEASLTPFVTSSKACLVLTNRYDGLDLPDDTCRLAVINGVPNATNLQEKFLWSRLNATAVLRERIRTRLMQAFGRCTRNDTDYAAIVLIGEELFDFCAKPENTSGMHPEIRAELKFGVENSADISSSDEFLELLQTFFEQGEDWQEANTEIIRLRNELTENREDSQEALAATTKDEVEFCYALWSGDYGRALQFARSVTDRLSGDALKGYRGWWYYLAGSAAWLAGQTHDPSAKPVAKEMFFRAANCAPSVRWLVDLAKNISDGTEDMVPSTITAAAVENQVNLVMSLGLTGPKFEKRAAELHGKLAQSESTPFELGLEDLGKFLGFRTLKPDGNAAPDAVWYLNDHIIVFEAKSDATNDSIPVSTLRQAKGHYDWVKTHLNPAPSAKVIVVVVTPQTRRDADTTPFVGGLSYRSTARIQELAKACLGKIRECRSRAVDRDALSRALLTATQESQLSPDALWLSFIQTTVSSLNT